MTGLKHYLTITGEGNLMNLVKDASISFHDLDQVLEGLMQEMIVKPLSRHLNCLMIQFHSSHLADRIKIVKEENVENDDHVIDEDLVTRMKECQTRLRDIPYSVMDKMACIQEMVNMVNMSNTHDLVNKSSTHEIVQVLSRLIVEAEWSEAGLEVDYVWGLINTKSIRYFKPQNQL